MTRRQNLVPQMGKRKRIIASITAAMLFLLAIGLGIAAYVIHFKHPDFEERAKEGSPQVADGYMYEMVNSKFEYTFGLATNVYQQEDGSCNVYFMNPETCPYYLRYEMQDATTGKTIYKSDVLKPGQYIENLPLQGNVISRSKGVNVIIYAWEQDTWYSAGNTALELVLQPW